MRLVFALFLSVLPGMARADHSQQRWPTTEWSVQEPSAAVDRARLNRLLNDAFADGNSTRAVLVVEDGAIVAERYAPGYSANTRFFSYSMAKSFVGTLAGILVDAGKLELHAAAEVPVWSAPHDPRGAIRLSHLLHMSTGLSTNEDYRDPSSDTMTMLFGSGRDDVAYHAARHPLKYRPGSYFKYSNGTSNILSGIIGRAVGGTEEDYRQFMQEALFEPIGMRSVVAGFDRKGNFVGSSYISATARDYARFGLLYLRKGRWGDRQVLSEAWVKYAQTPGPASSGTYGAHFWIGPSSSAVALNPQLKELWPVDAYSARGLWGQYVTIAPSKQLVVVVLGNTNSVPDNKQDVHDRLVGDILAAVSERDLAIAK